MAKISTLYRDMTIAVRRPNGSKLNALVEVKHFKQGRIKNRLKRVLLQIVLGRVLKVLKCRNAALPGSSRQPHSFPWFCIEAFA